MAKRGSGKGEKDEDLSLEIPDISKMGDFIKRFKTDHLVAAAFLLFALILVFSIRTIPSDLPVTDQWAEQTIMGNLRADITQRVNQQFPTLPQDTRDQRVEELVQQTVDAQRQEFEAAIPQLSQQFRSALQYTGEDGREYTYLGDLDSYFWLRHTRNWLDHGTQCDVIRDGECWNTYVLAPVGSRMEPGLHALTIGYMYKFMTAFNPDYPLPAASFLVPVLLGVLGVIPAFFIGRKLAGNVGGLFAAILSALHPLLLSRSMGSDNDVWNVILPLFVMWMIVEAVTTDDMKRRVAYGAAAGLLLGIHSFGWVGWWFAYVVIVLGLLGYLLFRIARRIIAKDFKVWQDRKTILSASLLVVFYIATFLFTALFSGEDLSSYVKRPLVVLQGSGSEYDVALSGGYWPNVLTTVAELNNSSFGEAIGQMGGKLFFFAALVGLMLLVLPRNIREWGWEQYSIFGLGAIIYIYLLNSPGMGRWAIVFLIGLPVGLILLLNLFRDHKIDIAPAFILVVWLLASVYATYAGVRFILLMIVPYALAFGITADRAYAWISSYAAKEFPIHKYITNAAVFIVIVLVLIQPVKAGYSTAYGFIPTMDDAWWDSLTKIRQESAPDAIINSWWDFGHWFKYVADRRVSADGTTQNTHVPHWLGLALVTPDEREAVGVLRMLDCGSDALPKEEGLQGAYAQLLELTGDPIAAHDILVEIVGMDRGDARAYLLEQGFSEDEVGILLERSHCEPPEDYFITSGDMVGKAGVWAHFGLWDFEKAYAAQEFRSLPRQDAVQEMIERFGYTEEAARARYSEIQTLGSEQAINSYIAPWPGYITQNWVGGCREDGNGTVLACPMNLGIGQQAQGTTVIEGFIYDKESPNSSRFIFSVRQGSAVLGRQEVLPSRLIVAGEELAEVNVSGGGSGIGVLLDIQQGRILLADPLLVDSMFTQLFYLEGRYNDYFDKFDDRRTVTGLRVLTWKVDWDGANSS